MYDIFDPNASIAYRVLLTILMTIASTERSFSKLNQLKSYMYTTVTQEQEQLNNLVTIALEGELLWKIDYKDMVEDLFQRT